MFYPLWDLKDRSVRLKELANLQRSEWWSRERLAELQLSRLGDIIDYAWNNTRFYRKHWVTRPKIIGAESIADLPVTTKAHIRKANNDILSQSIDLKKMVSAKTGGSTGIALSVRFDRPCEQMRNAAAMRSNYWAGWRPGMWIGALWGTPPLAINIKQTLRNYLHDRMEYLDTMHLNPETMGEFILRFQKRHAKILFGHAHSIYILARFVAENRVSLDSLEGIISTSMKLLDHERQAIENAFQCTVTDRYGCEEVGLIAAQCEQHDGFHVNSEHVFVEILGDDDKPVAAGDVGKIVVTDLINRAMPLIRYELGDMAAWSDKSCKCGRQHSMLSGLVGRIADSLLKRDGSLVAGVSLVEKTLTNITGLEQLQIVQETMTQFTLHIVCDSKYSASVRQELGRVMCDVFGDSLQIQYNELKSLPQDSNGKYRFSICNIETGK